MPALFSLIGGLRGILAAIGGAGVALALFLAWNSLLDNPRIAREAKAEGARIERIAWQIAMQALRDQLDADRKKAEAAIARVEREYLAEQEASAAEWRRALDNALSLMESDNAHEAVPDPCRTRPAIPRSLSKHLDAIGR